jgi:hypothetical protein
VICVTATASRCSCLTSNGRQALRRVRVALDQLSAELDRALGGPDRQRELRRLLLKVLD